jgi:hypothetical protein
LAVAPPAGQPVAEPEEVPPVDAVVVEPAVAEPVVADVPSTRSSWLDRLRDRR